MNNATTKIPDTRLFILNKILVGFCFISARPQERAQPRRQEASREADS